MAEVDHLPLREWPPLQGFPPFVEHQQDLVRIRDPDCHIVDTMTCSLMPPAVDGPIARQMRRVSDSRAGNATADGYRQSRCIQRFLAEPAHGSRSDDDEPAHSSASPIYSQPLSSDRSFL